MHIGLRTSNQDICGKIIDVFHYKSEHIEYKHIQLEDYSEYKFFNERSPKYLFIQILEEPHSKMFRNWNAMSLRQRVLILFVLIVMIIIDVMYIVGWSVDELTKLQSQSGDIVYCGKDSVYMYNQHELEHKIYYQDICAWNHDQCDMEIYGEFATITCITSVLLNSLIWVCMLIIVFYDRHFIKNICNRIMIFMGFILSGIFTLIAMILWSGVEGSRCKDACEYVLDDIDDNSQIQCEWLNGSSYVIYFTVSWICVVFGIFLSVIVRYV